jgi:hypothetical protein
MKAKLKFDTAVIKNFFSDHWEKFIVAGSIIVLLVFIVSAFKRETLPSNLQPNQILAKTSSLELTIRDSQWVEPTDLKPTEVPGAIAPLPAAQLSEFPPFIQGENRVFEDPNKRTDPTLLPVVALQATGRRGGLATGGSGAGIGVGGGPIGPRQMIDQSGPQPGPRSHSGPASGPAPSPAAPTPRSTRGRVVAAAPAPAVQPKTSARTLPGQQLPLASETGPASIPAGFELPGAQGGGSAESRHFVIVTGAIPVLDQLKEYDRRFSHARHGEAENAANLNGPGRGPSVNQDVPLYVWWRLERIDLTNGEEKTVIDYGNMEQVRLDVQDKSIGLDLMKKSLKPSNMVVRLNKDHDEWQGSGAEVVPDAYLADPWLSWPLPPILLRDWGREATNPKIPLTPPEATDTPDATTPSAEPGATKPADSADPFSKPAGDDRPATSQRAVPFARSGPAPSSGYSGRGVGGFQPRGRDRWARGPAQAPATIGRPLDADAPQVPYKLFRFVDFDVVPGHSYQYRVQLVLKNPNFGLASELLATPNATPIPYRETPWSEASGAATVPLDTQLVAETVERPKRGDPKAKAGVLQWDKKDSVELIATADLELGAIANFIQRKLTGVVDPVNRAIRDFTADFVSDGALLDLHGGGDEKAGIDAGGPGEMLFLVVGRDGKADQLVVVNQALDKPLIDGWDKTHKVPPELMNATDSSPGFLGSRGPASSGPAPLGGLLPGARGPTSSREPKTPAPKSAVPGK